MLLLPGDLFFIDTIELPAVLEAGDIEDFVELSLEAVAPFPIEQLNWGYLYHAEMSTILVYAAHRERLKDSGYTDLTNYVWVLPDFAILAGACFPEDVLVALESAHCISLLHFAKGMRIPRSVWVDRLGVGEPAQVLATLKANAKDLSQTCVTIRLCHRHTDLNDREIPTFYQAALEQAEELHDYGTWQKLTAIEESLWHADVRSREFKQTERNTRRIGTLIGRIATWAGFFALFLIGFEVALFAGHAWLDTLQNKIDAQRTAVLRIEDQQTLINKLEQVARNELRPIAILAAANEVRLGLNLGIEYDEVVIEGENKMTIEGKAASINSLNRYTESLQQTGQFKLLGDPESITRGGKTTFTVSLVYIPTEPSLPGSAAGSQRAPIPEVDL